MLLLIAFAVALSTVVLLSIAVGLGRTDHAPASSANPALARTTARPR